MAIFAISGLAGRATRPALIFPLMNTLSHDDKIALSFCLGISAALILRLWIVHEHDSFLRKCFWSLVLLVPVLGWVFYGGCYTPISPRGDSPGPIFDSSDPANSGGSEARRS